jgi:hypothetical protein
MRTRLLAVLVAAVAALAVSPAAWAGSQLRPEHDDVVAVATPAFAVELAADDLDARIDVTTEDGAPVGSCTPAPAACVLPAPLANGAYLWTLHFRNSFCDGFAGELCGTVERLAGPRRLVVEVPRPEPATIVLGRSIGAARLGMSRADLRALYGAPLQVRGAVERYAAPGGALAVSFVKGRARSISTTSAYYRLPGGLTVGARAPAGWLRTPSGLSRSATALAVARGRIVRITIAR